MEYVSNPFKVVEELYRIAEPNAIIYIYSPYWHSSICYPHINRFNVDTFNYFNGKFNRSFATKVRLETLKTNLYPSSIGKLIPPIPFWERFCNGKVKDFRHRISYFICEIIVAIDFELKVIK